MVGDFGYVLLLPCHCGAFGRPHTFCRRMKQVNLAIVLQQAGLVGLLVCAVGAFRYVVLVERPEDRGHGIAGFACGTRTGLRVDIRLDRVTPLLAPGDLPVLRAERA